MVFMMIELVICMCIEILTKWFREKTTANDAKGNGFDCFDEAARRDPFASAVPPLSRLGCFCLLRSGPEPVRSSLINQVIPDSSEKTLLTPCLVWTLDLHESTPFRTLFLKPCADPVLLLAELQAPATTPS
uniref:Uncharacterized protein n=1 Tax=Plectus sambesii TaxID=2011161 RepID=A0A914X1X6_9BILA